MAKDKSLDDVVNSIGYAENLGQMAQRQTYNPDYQGFLAYRQASGVSGEKLTQEARALQNNPQSLSDAVRMAIPDVKKRAVESAKSNIHEILAYLGEKVLPSYAFDIFGRTKEYNALEEGVKNGDYNSLRETYIGSSKDDTIHSVILQYAHGEKILEIAQEDMQRIQSKFIMDNFMKIHKEKDKKGNERDVPKYDADKAVKYVTEQLGKMDEKKQAEAYYTFAKIYAGMKAQEESEKAKKTKGSKSKK